MSVPAPIGYVTLRIPILAVTESESWEIPEEYTYLSTGDAELVTHDIPAAWHQSLRDDIVEAGIDIADWTEEELAAKTTITQEPVLSDRLKLDFHFLGGTR